MTTLAPAPSEERGEREDKESCVCHPLFVIASQRLMSMFSTGTTDSRKIACIQYELGDWHHLCCFKGKL